MNDPSNSLLSDPGLDPITVALREYLEAFLRK